MIVDILELAAHVGEGRRLMGLDLGTKTIGLALSDVLMTIATPLETIRRVKFGLDADALIAIAKRHDVGGLVLGYPLNMDGSRGPRAQASESFARNLAIRSSLPVALWDERLSTVAVTRTLIEANASRKRRGEVVDKMAAAFILQGALDRLGFSR